MSRYDSDQLLAWADDGREQELIDEEEKIEYVPLIPRYYPPKTSCGLLEEDD